MSCSNCFNGCSEIVSDQCVKYTGVDVPVLGIKTGDSLSYVEQALIGFLTSTLDGSGIKPNIDPTIICDLVKQYLPTCGDLTVVDLITALIKAACDLQEQVDAIVAELAVLNAPYDIPACLTGVGPFDDTHTVLQAVMDKLCIVETNLTALTLNVATNYVAIADINSYIAAYLASIAPGGTAISTKMVPYTVVEYYGSLANFDSTGAGIGIWENIYLCNGLNSTPDKRGRVGVGAIKNVPGGTLDAAVDPLTPVTGVFNPNYDIYDKAGANSIILTPQQIPAHTHIADVVLTDPQHDHGIPQDFLINGSTEGGIKGSPDWYTASGKMTSKASTGITVSVSNRSTGGDQPHDNKQPVLACYYIMYIP